MGKILGAEVEVAKRIELHKLEVTAKRRVVERSFAWPEKFHRLWKNCERKLFSSLAVMQLAFIARLLSFSGTQKLAKCKSSSLSPD